MLFQKIFENFSDIKFQILVDHFTEILLKTNCDINLINAEWQVLKSFMAPLIKDNKALPYLQIWKPVFTNKELNENANMCYKYLKYYLLCYSHIWKFKNVKSQIRPEIQIYCFEMTKKV